MLPRPQKFFLDLRVATSPQGVPELSYSRLSEWKIVEVPGPGPVCAVMGSSGQLHEEAFRAPLEDLDPA